MHIKKVNWIWRQLVRISYKFVRKVTEWSNVYRNIMILWFLNNNGILYNEDSSKRIADNTLVALTLMIAESKTEEKDVMVKVVVNLINQNN